MRRPIEFMRRPLKFTSQEKVWLKKFGKTILRMAFVVLIFLPMSLGFIVKFVQRGFQVGCSLTDDFIKWV